MNRAGTSLDVEVLLSKEAFCYNNILIAGSYCGRYGTCSELRYCSLEQAD